MQLFVTKGQLFHHCPGTMEQWDKQKNLPRDGPRQPKSGTGTGRDSQTLGRGIKWNRAEKDVLKQEKDVLKQNFFVFF